MPPPLYERAYTPADWPAVCAIYQDGIDSGTATFEAAPKSQQAFESEAIAGSHSVILLDTTLVGWSVLWPVSTRACYKGVAEVSLYVSAAHQGMGIGRALLQALIKRSEKLGLWMLQAAILRPNTASIALHEWSGFRRVGMREKIGAAQSVWHDIVLLERRSHQVAWDKSWPMLEETVALAKQGLPE